MKDNALIESSEVLEVNNSSRVTFLDRASEEPDNPIESTYYKIFKFASDQRASRAKDAFESGKFNSLEEAMAETPSPSVMSAVKAIAMNRSNAGSTSTKKSGKTEEDKISDKIEAIDYIVTHIMDITPHQFFNIWSTEFNKKYCLYPTINAIVNAAPADVWQKCYFDSKLVFFHQVWHNIYVERVQKINFVDIYYAIGDIKAGLIRAGSTANLADGHKTFTKGKAVDDILIEAINDVIFGPSCDFEDMRDILTFLAEDSLTYVKQKKDAPGICEIVDKRGYSSLYDFYFLQLNPNMQLKYAADFLEIRRAYKLPENPVMESIIEVVLEDFEKSRDE